MNIEDVREYCLSIKGAEECFPFDETTLVFKVMGKMFAYMGLEKHNEYFMINLKCDPEKAIELREKYSCVIPGYHSNKKYWNSIYLEQEMPDDELKQWINHSVDEVIKNLSKKLQEEYSRLINEA
jgi:predicted DNA-binding protein (MmcQ/YjbR family)